MLKSAMHRWTGQHGPHHSTTPPGEGGASRALPLLEQVEDKDYFNRYVKGRDMSPAKVSQLRQNPLETTRGMISHGALRIVEL
jgi:hypothetical protein